MGRKALDILAQPTLGGGLLPTSSLVSLSNTRSVFNVADSTPLPAAAPLPLGALNEREQNEAASEEGEEYDDDDDYDEDDDEEHTNPKAVEGKFIEGRKAGSVRKSSPSEELHAQSNWLVNDLPRRLAVSPFVPKVYSAEAGTASAGFLTSRLVEDASRQGGSFAEFLEEAKAAALLELKAMTH